MKVRAAASAVRFIHPNDDSVVALVPLHSLDDDAIYTRGKQCGSLRLHALRCINRLRHRCYIGLAVEGICGGHGAASTPVAEVWVQAVRHLMHSLIGLRIWIGWRTQQRYPHDVIVDIVPISSVVQQAHPVARFRKINPSVRHSLETGRIPTSVAMRGPLDSAVLNLRGCHAAAQIEWKRRLEQHMMLVPLDAHVAVNARDGVVD